MQCQPSDRAKTENLPVAGLDPREALVVRQVATPKASTVLPTELVVRGSPLPPRPR